MKIGLRSVEAHLREKLKDARFRELYELEEEKAKIASLVIRCRVQHHLTQGQLAKKLGVTQQQVSKIEQGDFSSLVAIQRILLALGYHILMRAVPLEAHLRRELRAVA
ncbi:MAG: helix-turn-helix domain-containing protein [Candidatus Omnitrophica bacterium]|nr:helix-turn-helix domain-containing protein [Candidatus Omnitrophota bacterium]